MMKANRGIWTLALLVVSVVLVVSSAQLTLAAGKLQFMDAPGSPIEIKGAWYGAIGDFNEDGHLDIAVLCPCYYSTYVCNYVKGGSAAISILFGNGDGTFDPKSKYFPVGRGSWNSLAIASGDFNNDGHLDLVVSNPGTGHEDVGSVGVFLLKGDGKGNFSQASFTSTGSHPTKMAIADFDKDGNLDVAVACSNFVFGHRVSLLFGNGKGGFERHDVMLPFGASVDDIVAADFNGDGWTDLAVPCGKALFVLLADPTRGRDRWFPHYTEYKLEYSSSSLAAGDFDGDGDIDLAISAEYHLITMLNDGQGKFTMQSVMETPNIYMSFHTIASDLNNDNRLDLAVLDEMGGQVGVYLGDGEGNFHRPVWPLFSVQWSAFETTMSNLEDYSTPVPAPIKVMFNAHGITLSQDAGIKPIQESTWQIIDRSIDKSNVYLLRKEGDVLDAYVSSSPVIPLCPACWRREFSETTWLGVADFNKDGRLDFAVRGGEIGVFNGLAIQLNQRRKN